MKRAGARIGLLVLLAGVPAVLSSAGGGPSIPGAGLSARDLSGNYLPLDAILKVLADIAWLLWLYIVAIVVLRTVAFILRRPGALSIVSDSVTPLPLRRLIDIAIGGVFVAASLTARASASPPAPRSVSLLAISQPRAETQDAVMPENDRSRTYTVRDGDSLWRIAEREFGDGFRWRDIYQLNRGRAFARGETFSNPRLIRPGWVLKIPARIDQTRSHHAARPAPRAASPAARKETRVATASSSASRKISGHKAPAPSDAQTQDRDRATPPIIGLPSGAVVAGSFASGLLAAQLMSRLRRRRTRRVQSPASSDVWLETPEPQLVRSLQSAGASPLPGALDTALDALATAWCDNVHRWPRLLIATERADEIQMIVSGDDTPLPPNSGGALTPRLRFSREHGVVRAIASKPFPPQLRRKLSPLEQGLVVPLGYSRDGSVVHAAMLGCRGLSIDGPNANDVAAQLTLGLAATSGTEDLHVMLIGNVPEQIRDLPQVVRSAPWDIAADLISDLQAELLRRARVMLSASADDVWEQMATSPDEAMPALLIVATDPPAALRATVEAIGSEAPGLGAALLSVAWTPAEASVRILANGSLTLETDLPVAHSLKPFTLDRAATQEAVAILSRNAQEKENDDLGSATPRDAAIIDIATTERIDEMQSTSALLTEDSEAEEKEAVPSTDGVLSIVEDAPPPAEPEPVSPASDRPAVLCLGATEFWRDGRSAQKGIRARARELLMFLIANPEGATKDRIIETLWPDLEPMTTDREFDRAASQLRKFARGMQDSKRYIEKSVDTFRLNRSEWWVDAWEMESLATEAERSPYADVVTAKLKQAIRLYRGDFCSDSFYAWAEPVREHYRAILLRACVRLSELSVDDGNEIEALEFLDRALLVDPFCEDIARLAIKIEVSLGRRAPAMERYRLLKKTLRENLDVDPSAETQALMRQISSKKEVMPLGVALSTST